MLLSDTDIAEALATGDLSIEPLGRKAIQPASVDVHLGDGLRIVSTDMEKYDYLIDPEYIEYNPIPFTRFDLGFNAILLPPKAFAIAATAEYIKLPSDMAATITGISSLARVGLTVTAAWIDPGFEGNITLEFVNSTSFPIRLRRGMRIAQFAFFRTMSDVSTPYGSPVIGSKYQGQTGTQEARASVERVC